MAIESVTSKIQGQQIFEQGVDLKLADAQTAKTTAPILGGESVKVTDGSMTDLEKLVARLKNESEATRQSVAERRAAILSTVLDSLADRITEAERENILKIEELNAEKTAAMKDLDGFKSSKAVLESLIESLDRQIEQAVKDGAEHREQVEKLKERRAEEQAKLDRIDASIQSISSKVAGIDVKIAECTKAIAASTLSEVSAALKAAAGDDVLVAEKGESDADRARAEAKSAAHDLALHISAALDKIDGQIRAALDEAQTKVEG